MKNVLDNGKEIRRQIIAAGWYSVAHWARENEIDYRSLKHWIVGRRPASKKFLAALQKTNIKIKFRTVDNGNQVHTRVKRKDSKPAKPKTSSKQKSGRYQMAIKYTPELIAKIQNLLNQGYKPAKIMKVLNLDTTNAAFRRRLYILGLLPNNK